MLFIVSRRMVPNRRLAQRWLLVLLIAGAANLLQATLLKNVGVDTDALRLILGMAFGVGVGGWVSVMARHGLAVRAMAASSIGLCAVGITFGLPTIAAISIVTAVATLLFSIVSRFQGKSP